MSLPCRTVHFGFGYVVPFRITYENVSKIETNLTDKGYKILGKNTPSEDLFEIKCKRFSGEENSEFTIKFQKAGEVDSAIKEPIFALAIIVGENGNHLELKDTFTECIKIIDRVSKIPKVVIQKEATLRTLCGIVTQDKTSFQYLWEEVLNQKPEKLKALGTPISGGGLRFLVAPRPIEVESHEIVAADIKIESYFKDPRFIFVEAKYKWVVPVQYADLDEICTSIEKNTDYAITKTVDIIKDFFQKGGT
jgi:hypothetical protein